MILKDKLSLSERDGEIDLSKLFAILLDYKWYVALFTLLTSLMGIGYALLVAPVYTANASIQVEDKSSGGILKEFGSIFDEKSSSDTEIAILRSRMVLSNTVEQLNLTTQIKPELSFISKVLSKWEQDPKLTLTIFNPKDLSAIFTIEVGDQDNFKLFFEGRLLLEGKIGTKYQLPQLELLVSSSQAKVGQRFTLRKIDELSVIMELQKYISISESGKQTGIINISFNGEDKEYIKKVVKSISENYLLQNIARNSAEASKSLSFLREQLPELKKKLSDAENSLNEFRLKNDSIDLTLEAKSALETIVQLESDLNELTIKESEISQKFTKSHPAYLALNNKRKVLNDERNRLNKQIERFPNTQKEIIRLTRDLEVNQQIYIQLLNKIQELEIVKASSIGYVRILDSAEVLPDPVAPKKMLIIGISTILGFVLSSLFFLIKDLFHRGIESTNEVDNLGIPTYATVPYSDSQPHVGIGKLKKSYPLLSESHPMDFAVESLRSLRTSLHFAMLEAKNNIVMISGTSPSVGKSFISANLANVLSKTGQRILLIDADLRRSYLRRFLGLAPSVGLSSIISQKNLEFSEGVQSYGTFSVIIKGDTPPNPSELLASSRFKELLEWASKNYDLVIVDTAPILAVTDPAIVGRYAGTSLLVGYFGQTTLKEIESAKDRFEKSGVAIKGFILNGVKKKASNRYEYYHYDYK